MYRPETFILKLLEAVDWIQTHIRILKLEISNFLLRRKAKNLRSQISTIQEDNWRKSLRLERQQIFNSLGYLDGIIDALPERQRMLIQEHGAVAMLPCNLHSRAVHLLLTFRTETSFMEVYGIADLQSIVGHFLRHLNVPVRRITVVDPVRQINLYLQISPGGLEAPTWIVSARARQEAE